MKILLEILPAHFDALLTETLRHEPQASDRKLLSEIKLLRSFEGDKWVRRAVDQLAVSLDSLVPVERLRECGLPKTQAFVESEWPSI